MIRQRFRAIYIYIYIYMSPLYAGFRDSISDHVSTCVFSERLTMKANVGALTIRLRFWGLLIVILEYNPQTFF